MRELVFRFLLLTPLKSLASELALLLLCIFRSLEALVFVSTSNNYCIKKSVLVTLSILKRKAEENIVNVGFPLFSDTVRFSFRGE